MITDYLKRGKENAVSLEYLAKISGTSKRKVRDEINRINTAGEEIICNAGDGTGYYIAADLEEAKAYRAYNKSYWQSGIEKDKGIARCMERRFSGADGNGVEMKYIASWSGGKDSTASIILAHEHNEPLDLIIFSEVMFDENISGELPEHINFIKNKAIPKFEEWGYEVKILHSGKTYLDCFHHIATKGKRVGKKLGFPMSGKCLINRECKMQQIRRFLNNYEKEFTQYIGIAIDEPVRMKRIAKTKSEVSLLEKYGYTEQMAFDLCEKYDLLSPIYDFAPRGGCWFCPNARYSELRHLRMNHKNLWNKLIELENEPDLIGNKWNMLTNTKIHDWEERFFWEERQISIFEFMEEPK